MNYFVILGRLTRDPEAKEGVTRFTVAVDRPTRKDEEKAADFIQVTCFGKTAEIVGRYLTKGRQVGVEGHIRTGVYDKKDGHRAYFTDLIADKVSFIDRAEKSSHSSDFGANTMSRSDDRRQGQQRMTDDDDFYVTFGTVDATEIPF